LRSYTPPLAPGPWETQESWSEGPFPVVHYSYLANGEPDADLTVHLRNHTEAILALVKAATSMQRLHGFVVGHSWPLEMMPEVMAAERELDRITASVGALNGS